jgi:uncharacterized membrane protein HdeD (DUF308 family)
MTDIWSQYPIPLGIFFILFGIIVLIWVLKYSENEDKLIMWRAIYGGVLSIALGLILLFDQ